MAVPANFSQELGAINFSQVIGGPLVAAVEAHNMAQLAVVDFINEVGFDTDNEGNPTGVRTVTFKYEREKTGEDGATSNQQYVFTVPFILLLRLPYFDVDSVDISLNVELTSVETRDTKSVLKGSAGGGLSLGLVGRVLGGLNFKASLSGSRTTKTGVRVERKYSYQVRVHAGSEEPPEGVNKLLDALVTLATEREESGSSS